MTTSPAAPHVSWTRAFAATLALPVLAALGASATIGSWSDDLPDPVAVHFGPGGEADGFASLTAATWSPLLGPAVAAVFCLLLLLLTRRDARAARTGVAVAAGIGVFVAALPAA
ncbi:DUF1648 domain-containing protein, partial [Rhodococcus sp. NPDC059234]|uniref:DUF1648 domain-containing protein n=1 Tax=Rhodococcus sp. NPDC059234 TaxID=3346781 RepID=UPI003672CA9D